MTLSLENNAANPGLDGALDVVNGGTLKLFEGATEIVELTFAADAAADASGGTKTFNAIGTGTVSTATTTGMDTCKGYNSSSQLVWTGTVGTSGADVNLDSVDATVGQVISISSGTASHA